MKNYTKGSQDKDGREPLFYKFICTNILLYLENIAYL